VTLPRGYPESEGPQDAALSCTALTRQQLQDCTSEVLTPWQQRATGAVSTGEGSECLFEACEALSDWLRRNPIRSGNHARAAADGDGCEDLMGADGLLGEGGGGGGAVVGDEGDGLEVSGCGDQRERCRACVRIFAGACGGCE
jgi:hypothetical protein